MKRELKGILSVLQGNQRQVAGYDWHYALGLLLLNRVGVSFYHAARDTKTALPRQVDRILYGLEGQQIRRNKVMAQRIADLSYELMSTGIRFAFLKGSVLSYCSFKEKSLYRFGERVSNDVDILVSPKDLGAVDRVLVAFGFVQGEWKDGKVVPYDRREIVYRRMTRGETAPYLLATQSAELPFIELDINYSLGYLPSGDAELVKELLSDCKDYAFCNGGTILSLSEEKFLLHLIMHQYKEATLYWMMSRHKDSQLYKYLDIARMLAADIVDLQKFGTLVKRYELQEQAAYVLYFCNQLFPSREADGLMRALCPQRIEEWDKVTDAEHKTAYLWTKGIYERVGIYDKARYLKRL